MKRALVAVAVTAVAVLGLLACATGPSREQGLVNRAVDAMGGPEALAGIKTIAVKGSMKQWEPEQSDVPGGEMRFANESTYEIVQDRASRSSRTDWEKKLAYPAPRTYKYSEILTPEAGYVMGVDTTGRNAQSMKSNPPAHAMSSQRLATSQREARRGSSTALLLEMRNNPDRVSGAPDVLVEGISYPAVTYAAGNGQYIVAFDRQSGLPARVRTLDYDNVWGDVNFDLAFSQWRDFSGVKIPMNRKYEMNGRVITEATFTDVRLNAPVDAARLQIPADVLASAAKPATAKVPYQWVIRRQIIGTLLDAENIHYDPAASQGLRLEEIAPGVQHIVGGSHNSLAVEMSDHLIVFDAPISDWQSKQAMDALKAKYPGKPVRYLVLTHHHMDHTGGLRGYLTDGATLVVGQGAGAHFRRVVAAPWTRNPDIAPRDLSRTPVIEVTDRYVFSDGKRQVSAHLLDNPHAKGMLIGYVPDAQLGFVTDLWSPGRDTMPAQITNPLMAVVQAVRKAGLQPTRFAGGHGATGEYAPLSKLAGP